MPPSNEIRCPIARTAILIGDRWTPLIVRDLEPGCRRFSELQRSLEDGVQREDSPITRNPFVALPVQYEFMAGHS